MLNNKKVVVIGVSGSIAIYKTLDIIRELKKRDIVVFVVMTEHSKKFISPLLFSAISENPVITDIFETQNIGNFPHIDIDRISDIFLICPATANIISKAAAGIGDDALSTFLLSATSPIIIAPAMNTRMWENKIIKENINKLKNYGFYIIPPEKGTLACGEQGCGKLPDIKKIIDTVLYFLNKDKDFAGKKILITASCTQEAIDPIRFISNYSSGKMGFALAEKAKQRGADVILITGPTFLSSPSDVKIVRVKTADEMRQEVLKYFDEVDIVLKAAAVVDFKVKNPSSQKIKKTGEKLILELEENIDILHELGKRKNKQFLVGFAAETEQETENAIVKLKRKNLDMIVVNNITKCGSEMGSDTNEVKIIYKNGVVEELPLLSKLQLSDEILNRIERILKKKGEKIGEK